MSQRKIIAFTTVSQKAYIEDPPDDHRPAFPLKVQTMIDCGWQPYGDVFVVPAEAHENSPWIGLAMVKYADS